MIGKRYLQLSFLLPLLIPALVVLTVKLSYGNKELVLILLLSLILGGIPYLLFLVGVLFWTRHKDEEAIQRMTFIAPILFIPVFLICVIIALPIQYLMLGKIRIEGDVVFQCCIMILILGYCYVTVVNVGYFILKAIKSA